eukprot:4661061-Lingulodinium_polyedra.AAC.1
MEHFNLRVEPLETWQLLQQRDIACREVEIDLPRWTPCQGRQLLVRDSLQEGLRDVGRADRPTLAHRLRDDELLRALRARASVAVDIAALVVLEASDSEPCSDGANWARNF